MGGSGGSRHRDAVLPTAAHVARGENALQRPQHDDAEQHDQNEEEHEPPPIPGMLLPDEVPRRPRRRLRGVLARADVDADAQGRGAFRSHAAFVAQLLAFQPHGLLLLLVVRELAEDLVARGQSRGPLLGQRRGLATEGAGDVIRGVVAALIRRGDGHETREALQAEGVRAVQHLGRLEDVVIDVIADGTLRLIRHGHLPLGPSLLGGRLHVPNLLSLLHLQKCRPLKKD